MLVPIISSIQVSPAERWKRLGNEFLIFEMERVTANTILNIGSFLCPEQAWAPWLCFSWLGATPRGDYFSIPANRSLMCNFNRPSKYCMLNQFNSSRIFLWRRRLNEAWLIMFSHCTLTEIEGKRVWISVQQTNWASHIWLPTYIFNKLNLMAWSRES